MPEQVTAICPSHPDGEGKSHECMSSERRCVCCDEELIPYNCHGCGRFLTAEQMYMGARCEDCE